jgi:hypothetical protein
VVRGWVYERSCFLVLERSSFRPVHPKPRTRAPDFARNRAASRKGESYVGQAVLPTSLATELSATRAKATSGRLCSRLRSQQSCQPQGQKLRRAGCVPDFARNRACQPQEQKLRRAGCAPDFARNRAASHKSKSYVGQAVLERGTRRGSLAADYRPLPPSSLIPELRRTAGAGGFLNRHLGLKTPG